MSDESNTITLRDGRAFIELRPSPATPRDEGYPALARFGWGRISADWWPLELFDPQSFADELRDLHASLAGEASLSDRDGLALTLSLDHMGRLRAEVWLNGPWALEIEQDLSFTIDAGDQSCIPHLIAEIVSAFPKREGATTGRATRAATQ